MQVNSNFRKHNHILRENHKLFQDGIVLIQAIGFYFIPYGICKYPFYVFWQ